MRKLIGCIIFCSLLTLLPSCSGKQELKEALAVVQSMTDSTVVATVDGSDATLVTTEVRITNGAYMPGDSIRLYYVGRLSSGKARAMLIAVIPRPSEVIGAGVDLTRELKTASPEEQEQQTSEQ